MKMWLKISIICITVLLLVVAACSTLLLVNSKQRILSTAIDSALSEQYNLQTSVSGMAAYYGTDDLSDIAKQSLVKYCFLRFAGDTAVLSAGNELIWSNLEFSPVELLPLKTPDEQEYTIDTIGGRNVLIAGCIVNILSSPYSIYIIKDITPVSESISDMVWQFAMISLVFITIGVALIIVLVRYSTKNIKKLGESAKRISKGYYSERAEFLSHDEIGEMSKDFNVMAQAVEDHVAELTEFAERQRLFIGGLTHEFKTPLTSIIGHAETLLFTSMPEDMVQGSLLHIHEQCQWLERLTQKLLQLIALKGQAELKETYVQELFDSVKSSADEILKVRQVNLQTSCTIDSLLLDSDLMQSLLINLIDNASKASSPGQTVYLSAYDRTIEVRDSGIGMSKDEIEHIMEPFYMADKSRNKKNGGSGLGLALVSAIADVHGAKIEVESAPGNGAVVKVIFI